MEQPVPLGPNGQYVAYRLGLIPSRRFEYISASVGGITGYTPDEFYADPNLDAKIVHPGDRQHIALMVEDPSISPLLRFIRTDGEVVWMKVRNMPLHDGRRRLVAVEGIARVLDGPPRTDERTSDIPLSPESPDVAIQSLTRREMDVLWLVAEGLCNVEIAKRLLISNRTVDHHVSSLLKKLDAHSRTAAVAFAFRMRLLDWRTAASERRSSR